MLLTFGGVGITPNVRLRHIATLYRDGLFVISGNGVTERLGVGSAEHI